MLTGHKYANQFVLFFYFFSIEGSAAAATRPSGSDDFLSSSGIIPGESPPCPPTNTRSGIFQREKIDFAWRTSLSLSSTTWVFQKAKTKKKGNSFSRKKLFILSEAASHQAVILSVGCLRNQDLCNHWFRTPLWRLTLCLSAFFFSVFVTSLFCFLLIFGTVSCFSASVCTSGGISYHMGPSVCKGRLFSVGEFGTFFWLLSLHSPQLMMKSLWTLTPFFPFDTQTVIVRVKLDVKSSSLNMYQVTRLDV